MTITQAACTSFKSDLLLGTHNFNSAGGNTFKLALFIANVAGTYGAATTNYSNMTTDEVAAGNGYTTGGNTLTNSGVSTGGTTAFTSFSNTTWTNSTISSSGALLYNSTQSNKACLVLSFGSTVTSTNGNFTVQFPSNDQNNAIIRIS